MEGHNFHAVARKGLAQRDRSVQAVARKGMPLPTAIVLALVAMVATALLVILSAHAFGAMTTSNHKPKSVDHAEIAFTILPPSTGGTDVAASPARGSP